MPAAPAKRGQQPGQTKEAVMFWIGLFIGMTAGVMCLAIFQAGKRKPEPSIDDCEKCKITMCAECPYPRDLEALESMYKSEKHARRTAHGQLKSAQEKMCRMLGQMQEVAR